MKKIKSTKGFTIIEALIVLAIIGAIMLILFLAVPALRRNQRNTTRKNDVASLLAAVNEYAANNNGANPAAASDITSISKVSYYGTADVALASGAQTAITTDTVKIVTGAKCGASGATVAGSSRQIAAQYMTEVGSTLTATCQDS